MPTLLPVSAARPPRHALRRHSHHGLALRPVGLAMALAGLAPLAFGLPEGAQLVSGQATVTHGSTQQLDIRQTSARAGLDWTRFSIGAQERVVVTQPGRDAVLVNRVVGNDPSQILGRLQSNGTVWLINPRGIVFGRDSQVDVGGLLASTLRIRTEDMASGRLLLSRGDAAEGEPGALRADGRISAPDGSVVLVAPSLVQAGQINARRIGLAAATAVQVDVEGDGLVFFNIRNDGSLATRLQQLGTLRADGGTAELRAAARAGFADTVLNLDGVVQARSLGQRTGRIVIDGGDSGVTQLAGVVDASGSGPGLRGGSISVLGEKIALLGTARLDATGDAGGGQIRLGGDWQGGKPGDRNAQQVLVQAGALLDASAGQAGDGGLVVVWADQATQFQGAANARGGATRGDGGLVEVSGKGYLDYRGASDRSAPSGKTGLLLLDPLTLEIVDTGGADINGAVAGATDLVTGTLAFGDFAGAASKITAGAVVAQLAGGPVLLQAVGNLTVTKGFSTAATNALTLEAGADVLVSDAITTAGNITLSGGTPTITGFSTAGKVSSAVNITTTGTLSISNGGGANTGVHALGGTLTAAGLSVTGNVLNAAGLEFNLTAGTATVAATISGAGSITKNGGGALSLTGSNLYTGTTTVAGGTLVAGSANALGAIGAGTSVVGGTLEIGNIALAAEPLTITTGTLRLNGSAAAVTGTIALGANTLDISGGASVANPVTLTTGATITNSSGAGTVAAASNASNLSLASAGALTLSSTGTGTGLTVNRRIDNAVATAVNAVGGQVTLGVSNTYAGATTVSAGTLVAGNADALGTTAAGTTLTGGTLEVANVALAAEPLTITSGTLRMSGALASVEGTIALAGNTLDIRDGASVANAVTVANGASITNSSGLGTLAANATALTLGAGDGLTLSSAGTGLTVARAIAGAGSSTLVVSGAGAGGVTLTQTNTHGGGTTVNGGGTLVIGSEAPLGGGGLTLDTGTLRPSAVLSTTQQVTLGTGGGTVNTAAGDVTLSGLVTGAGTLTKEGANALVLRADNNYSGGSTVNAGTLAIDATTVAGADAGSGTIALGANVLDVRNGAAPGNAVSVNGGGITNSAGLGRLGGPLNLLGDATVDSSGTGLTLAGVVSETGIARALVTIGTVTLANTNTYTGGTTVSSGTLAIDAATVAGANAGTGAIAVGANALDLRNGAAVANAVAVDGGSITNTAGSARVNGTLTLDGNATVSNSGSGGTALRLAGVVAEAGGARTLNTEGTVVLANANAYTGTTTVDSGTLAIDASAVAGANAGSGSIDVRSNTLDLRNGAAPTNAVSVNAGTIANTAGAGRLDGAVNLRNNVNFIQSGSGTGLTLGGVVDSTGAHSLTTTGTVRLANNNTYTGTTTVSSGTLVIDASTVAGADAGSGTIALGANTLDIIGGASVANVVTLTTGATLANSSGLGTLATNATDLALGANVALTLRSTGAGLTVARVIDGAASASLTVSGAGAGGVTLTQANTHGGGTTVNTSGTLLIAADSALGSGGLTLATGTLRPTGVFSSSKQLTLGTGGGTVNTTAGNATLSGLVTGAGALTKAGTNALVLRANNDYSGGSTVSGGTLAIDATAVAGADAGSGTIAVGANVLDLRSGAVLANGVTVSGGSITNSAGLGRLDGPLTLAGNASLGSTGTGLTLAGVVSESGGTARSLDTSGQVTLANNNTYTGSTTLSSGTLVVSGVGSDAGSGSIVLGGNTLSINAGATPGNAVTVDAGGSIDNTAGAGTLAGALTLAGNATVGSSATGLTLAGAVGETGGARGLTTNGTVVLTNANGYSGGTTVNTGTLAIDAGTEAGANAGTGSITLGANTLDVRNAAAPVNAVTVAAGGSITNSSGTGTLAGALTLDGNASVGSTGTRLTLAGVVGETGGARNLATSGSVVLANDNTYTGTTTVGSGTLAIDAASVAGADAGSGAIVLGANVLDLRNAAVVANALSVANGARIASSVGGGTLAVGAGGGASLALANGTSTLNLSGSAAALLVQRPLDNAGGPQSVNVVSGLVTLAAANAHDGGTTVTAGTLRLAHSAAAGTGSITLGANTLDLVDGASVANVLTLATGATIANSSGLGTLANNATPLALGASAGLTLSSTGAGLTLDRSISGTGSSTLTVSGAGAVALTQANSHGGGTTVSAGGTLDFAADSALGGGNLTLANGTLRPTGVYSTSKQITLGTGGGTLDTGNGEVTLIGLVTGSGALTKAGTQALVLRANNDYSGGTTVTGGTLAIDATTVAGADAGSGTLTLGTQQLDLRNGAVLAAALTVNGGSITNSAGAGTLGGALTLAGDASLSSTGSGLTVAGVVGETGAARNLVTSGGTVTLAANNTYSGTTTVGSGTLVITGAGADAGSGAILLGASTLTINNGAAPANAVTVNGGSIANTAGAGTLAGALTLAGHATAGSSATALTLAGAVSESGGAAHSLTTNGTVVLGNAGTYTGGTTVNTGTLVIDGALASAGGAITLGANVLDLRNGASVANALSVAPGAQLRNSQGAGTLAFNAAGLDLANGSTLLLNSTATGLTIDRALNDGAGVANLQVSGAGPVALQRANALDGTLTVASAGTLAINSAAALGNASLLLDNGSLRASATLASSRPISLGAGGGTLDTGAFAVDLSGVLSGTGSLAKAGSGALTLLANNSNSGAIALLGGSLVVSGALTSAADAGSGAITVGAQRLVINSGASVANAVSVNGGAVANSAGAGTLTGTLALAGNGALESTGSSLLLTGVVSGPGNLAAQAGTVLLSQAANNWSGSTTVGAGTLQVAGGNAIPDASTLTLSGSGRLQLNANETLGALAGSGGTSALLGSNTLTVGASNADSAFAGLLDSGALGVVSKVGSGSLTLSGASSAYTGTTVVEAGTLQLGTAGERLGNSSRLVVRGGVVDLGGFGETVAGVQLSGGSIANGTLTNAGTFDLQAGSASAVLAGSAGIAKTGTGTVILSGANSVTGTTSVAAGTLRLAGANERLANASQLVVNGGTLDLGGLVDTVNSVQLSAGSIVNGTLISATPFDLQAGSVGATLGGSAGISKTGASTVTLSGDNSVTGTTSVAAGTLLLAAANERLADGSRLVVSGGALDLGGRTDTVAGVQLTGGEIRNGRLNSTSAFDLQAGSVSAVLGGAAGLAKTGAGTVTLSGAGSDVATATVSAGTLLLAGGDDRLASTGRLVVDGGTFDLGGQRQTLAGVQHSGGSISRGTLTSTTAFDLQAGAVDAVLAGTAGLGKTGAGTSTLSAANTYTGTTTVAAGTLLLAGADQRLAAAGTLVVNGGTLDLGGFSQALQGVQQSGGGITGGTLTSATAFDLQAGSASAVLDGSAGLNKTGAGTATLTGANRYTGRTTVAAGTLLLAGADQRLAADSSLAVSGGTLDLGGFSQALQGVQQTGGSIARGTLTSATTIDLQAGSASAVLGGTQGLAKTGDGTATLSGASTYTGTTTVDAGTLVLAGADQRLAAAGTLVVNGGTLDLGGFRQTAQGVQQNGGSIANGTLTSNSRFDLRAGTATAVLDGTLGLAKTGTGTATLSGSNTYTGTTTVDAGTLVLAGADQRLAAAGTLVVNGGTLDLGGFSHTLQGLQQSGGSLANGTLVSSSRFDMRAGDVSAVLAGVSVGLAKTGEGSLTLSGANTYTGVTTLDAGTLALAGGPQRLAADSSLVVNGGALDLGGVSHTVAGAQINGGSIANGTLDSDSNVALRAGTVTAVLAGSQGLTKTTDAAATLGGSNTYTGLTTVQSGNLLLDGAQRLAAGGSLRVDSGASLSLAGAQTLVSVALDGTLAGAGLLSAPTITLQGGSSSVPLSATLLQTDGAAQILADATANTFSVLGGNLLLGNANRLIDTAQLIVASGATLTLTQPQTVGALTLRGTLTGSGVLNAATYALDSGTSTAALGAGALTSTGSSTLDAAAAVDSVAVQTGTFSTGPNANFTALPAVTVAGDAGWALASPQRIGTLNGTGQVALTTHTLQTGAGGASRFDGAVTGTGSLVKQGGGVFTLGGANTFSGDTVVQTGTLVLAGTDTLSDATRVQVDAGATLRLDASDTVRQLDLAGTLAGTGTLSAGLYRLQDGTTQAPLGRGALQSEGSSRLGAAAAVDSIGVNAGSLLLDGADLLRNTPATTVAANALLQLGGNTTLGSLAGAGTVDLGSAALATGIGGSSTFSGAIDGTGSVIKQGGSSFTLAGITRHTGATTVAEGSLVLAGPDRLSDASALTVARGATLTLAGDDRVASVLVQGTLDGSGTLLAPTYALDGGTALANLGAGAFTSTGSSTLAGSAAADSVTVQGGSLTLASPERLADTASVSVAAGARLTLNGAERVDNLSLAGTLDGSGTLTAARTSLQDGTTVADLDTGLLTSRGSSSLLGTAAVGSIDLAEGTLSLGSAGRLLALPVLTIRPGARLALGGDEALGSLAGDGSVGLGRFTLSTGAGGSSTYSGAIDGLGGLIKRGADSSFTLAGSSTYSGSTWVAEGTLTVGDGANSGALATSSYRVDGVLQSRRADAVLLDQPVSGDGTLQQLGIGAGGTLTLQGNNKTHTGATLVSTGTLATLGDEALSDTSAVQVAAGAALVLGGAETIQSLVSAGTVDIASRLTASGALAFWDAQAGTGAARAIGGAPLSLAAASIDARGPGNVWGSSLAFSTTGKTELAAGRVGGAANGARLPLTLGAVQVGDGGRIEAHTMALTGLTNVAGGTLVLDVDRGEVFVAPTGTLLGKLTPANRQIALSEDVLTQTETSRITVQAGATLAVQASGGGSVALQSADNRFDGGLSVLLGAANQPWVANQTKDPASPGGIDYSLQNQLRVAGSQVNVGGAGIQADMVTIRAGGVRTLDGSRIVAKLPFDNLVGTSISLPALTLDLTEAAFLTDGGFGQPGAPLAVDVGSKAFGERTLLPVDSGFLAVLPAGGARGTTALFLTGPAVAATYSFFYSGAGQQGELPVFYNGVSAITPQVSGSISATVAVSEQARRERFEEAVRTENVALRLRAGVIAEVGPGVPATVSNAPLDKMRPPVCAPAPGGLACAAP